ncbi:MAG: hypothetical protein Ct9H300mP18_08940 [Candidatus Neomarinimicrobiota bacterium]|nr:MAG: hypothetical protein Ct9H300mP18_08940 [Candidatus Neomarinimicrobiota bacterium]
MNKFIFIFLFLVSCSKTKFESPFFNEEVNILTHSTQDGGLLISWFEKVDSVNWSINWSEFQNNKWSQSKPITSGRDFFVNWADFPSIYHFGSNSIAAHWLERSGSGTYDYDVKVVTSNNRGKTWSLPQTPHNDGKLGNMVFYLFIMIYIMI